MNNIPATPVKNIFSRTALKVLNACAKFAHNFSHGFGIKLTDSLGGKVVAIDTDSEALQVWIKDQSHNHKASEEKIEIKSGYESFGVDSQVTARDEVSWKSGNKDVELFVLCRQSDGGNEGALFFRKLTVNRLGHIVSIGGEDENFGWAVTNV